MAGCISCDKHHLDALLELNHKLALLSDLASQIDEANDFTLSGKACVGLYWFLQDAEEITSAVLAHNKEV